MATDESAHPGSVFRMEHCYVHDSKGGNNVKTRAERNEIRYNWIEGGYYRELELIGPAATSVGLKREDSDVVGNVFYKTNNFYVFRLGGDGTGETYGRYRFVNNTVVTKSGGSAVFQLFDGIESLEVHNNVFVSTGSTGPRILSDSDADWASGRKLSGVSNWIQNGATSIPSEWTGSVRGASPGFISLSSRDVRLTSTSALINGGATTLPSPSGAAFPNPLAAPLMVPPLHVQAATDTGLSRTLAGTIDLGAFEFSQTALSGPIDLEEAPAGRQFRSRRQFGGSRGRPRARGPGRP